MTLLEYTRERLHLAGIELSEDDLNSVVIHISDYTGGLLDDEAKNFLNLLINLALAPIEEEVE